MMIAEPYINTGTGEIKWWGLAGPLGTVKCEEFSINHWTPYADFEREKLKELGEKTQNSPWISVFTDGGFSLMNLQGSSRCSLGMIGYSFHNYYNDSESNRLLKRAEFLKSVCEKEGVEWLPKEKGIEFDRTGDVVPKKDVPSECECKKQPTDKEKKGIELVKELTDVVDSCKCSCHIGGWLKDQTSCGECACKDYFTKEEMKENYYTEETCDGLFVRKWVLEEDNKEWRKKILKILRKICICSDPKEPMSAFTLGGVTAEIDILLKELE